ncbi:MAG: uracil-DNA glycosylase [Ilumatobacteraceae bacterium]
MPNLLSGRMAGIGERAPLDALAERIESCRACPRLVDWRELVARERRAAYREETYWGRPVSGFGDPAARIVVLGLAPAAHGANRTGRVFTGDRSGDWLFAAMHRAGLASQAHSMGRDDGLELTGAWVTAAVRCAPPENKPAVDERDRCAPFLTEELALLGDCRVVVCLGAFGFQAACRHYDVRPRPRFGHGVEYRVDGGPALLGSFHPSQQNTFTGRLTESMLDDVFTRAVELARG